MTKRRPGLPLTFGFVLLLVALLAPGAPPTLAQSADANRVVPIDPAVRFGKLPNGLTYYIRKNARPEKRAELRLVVRAGSILEDNDQQGLAHFVEHMAFNGTRNFKKQELVDYLESIGVQFGAHLNAYTSFDETVYMLQVPTDSLRQLATSFQVLEDWAHGLLFDHTEMDKERGVVVEEWRSSRGADARMMDRTFPIIFKGSRYADRLPIGKKEIIEKSPYSATERFYRDWYRPDLMSVVAVGDFDVDDIEKKIRAHFGPIPMPANPRQKTNFPVPGHEETLTVVATDREAMMTNVSITTKLPATEYTTEGDYRARMVDGLVGAMISSRLQELSTSGNAPFAFAFASRSSQTPTTDFFDMSAYTEPSKMLRAIEVLATEGERARRHGFTATELERRKLQMMRSMESALAEQDKTESGRLIWEYVSHALGKGFVTGVEGRYALAQKYLSGITLEEVNRAATRLIIPTNRVIVVNAPEKENDKLPSGSELLAVVTRIEKGNVERYTDNVTDAPLLNPPSSAATVVSEQKNEKVGIIDWKLSNGVRVVLKPTTFKNDQVLMTAFSPGGSSLVSDAEYDAVSGASGIIGNSGVGQFDQSALGKKLAGKVANVGTYIGELYEGAYGSASPKDIETMMQLLHLRFTAPRSDTNGFNSYKTTMETFVANSENDPESLMRDTFSVTMSQNHPRRAPFNSRRIGMFDLARSHQFYRDRFADASDFTFVFVGNIEPESFKKLALQYIGTLPSSGRKENWKDVGVRYPSGVIEKSVVAGIEPKSNIRITFPGPFEWSDRNRQALEVTANVLSIMLREVLREDLGGTYGASVYASPQRYPRQQYMFNVGFGCAPDRVDELTRATFAVIDSLKRFGPTESNLNKVKEQARREREISLKENRFWMYEIEAALQNGESFDDLLDEGNLNESITADEVQQAAQRYLDTKNYVKVVLLPKEGAGTAAPSPAP